MKLMMKTLFAFLIALLAPLAHAQLNILSTTTLSTAITSTGAPPNNITTIILASTSNVTVPSATGSGSLLFIDGEAMQVLTIPVSGTVTVQRGAASTRPTAHAASVVVWIGNADWFNSAPPSNPPRGPCTASSLYASPDVHILDGNWYACDTLGLWGYAGPYDTDGQSRYAETGIGDAAYTALVTDRFIYFTAITATRVITLPAASSVPGKVITVSDAKGLLTTSIAIELNNVNNSATYVCGVSATPYSSCTVYSNGTAWVALVGASPY